MAFQPSLSVPPSSPTAVLSSTAATPVTVGIQLSRPGEFWWGYTQFRYRIGAGAYSYSPSISTYHDLAEQQNPYAVSNAAAHSFPGSTFSAGDYEIACQVQTNINGSWTNSGWSPSAFFSIGTPPTAPTITSPSAGATITSATANVTFTSSGSPPAYQINIMNGSIVEWDSGEVAQTGAGPYTKPASFPVNTVSRNIRVRTKSSGGLWSAWSSTVAVNVAWTPPMSPAMSSITWADSYSLGFNSVANWTLTNPTPTGGAPITVRVEFWWRLDSSSPDEVLLSSQTTTTGAFNFRWCGISNTGTSQEVKAIVYAADGTYREGSWATFGGAPGTFKGVTLHTPQDLTDIFVLRYNDEEITEERTVESALVAVAGREFPMVEFGPGGTRTFNVDTLHSKGGTTALSTTTDLAKIRRILELRKVVCYRDRRGRKMYARMTVGGIKDTPFGNTLSLQFEQAYETLAPPDDVIPV